jgi:enamine deaminase RidA (YjgF/YER057c/UK114 family)
LSGLLPINPEALGRPRGYSNGMLAPAGGRLLFVAGQIAWDGEQRLVGPGFVEQLGQALANVAAVVREAGGGPEHIARLTLYVTDKQEYLADLAAVGEIYRRVMGRHFPAMALVEVKGLLEPGAKVEIEATAVLPA